MLRMALVMLALAQAGKPNPSAIEDASSAALQRGDYAQVLELTTQGLAVAPHDGWLLYDRGASLASLGRLEDAVTVLSRAEATFPADQPWGRALSAYRRGLALAGLGRCSEAQLAMAKYATLMSELNREVAADAARGVADCERQNVRGR